MKKLKAMAFTANTNNQSFLYFYLTASPLLPLLSPHVYIFSYYSDTFPNVKQTVAKSAD
jgi:hypothetical protein